MSWKLIASIDDLREAVTELKRGERSIGLVPTMGALHAGHGALIEYAGMNSDRVVVSIFVNPIQFDRADDYTKYTRNLEADLKFCRKRDVDIVFAPTVEEMYPAPQKTFVEVTGVSERLCGEFRPGHFRGVATVVMKLFNLVQPDTAYFGQKDAQQLAVIRRMVSDLNVPLKIISVPTVREADGLALSTRNAHLTPEERAAAPALYKALEAARHKIGLGCIDSAAVKEAGLAVLRNHPEIRPEYFEVVDAAEMQPVQRITAPVCIAAAVWLGSTRLIDNVCYPESQELEEEEAGIPDE
jgi:pantoate--beta-alanine ligase